jgi:hypothetical protein
MAEGKITEDVVANMRSWKHSGFSVDQSVRLEVGDQQGVQRLIQYFLRCPFSQARMIKVTEAGKVIDKTEHLPAPRLRQAGNAVGRFPQPGDEELLAGPARNFQVFDPFDFLAEVTQHIPDPGSHLVRYYGWLKGSSLAAGTSERGPVQPERPGARPGGSPLAPGSL